VRRLMCRNREQQHDQVDDEMWNQLFWIQLITRVTKMQELSIPALLCATSVSSVSLWFKRLHHHRAQGTQTLHRETLTGQQSSLDLRW
jgi:hypothetical protein